MAMKVATVISQSIVVLDHLSVVFWAEGCHWAPFRAVWGFLTWLAPDSGKVGSSYVGRSDGRALLLVAICLDHGEGNHDDPLWAEHLELQAAVVWDGHEPRVAWPPQ